MDILLIALGGGIGAVFRYSIILLMNRLNRNSRNATILVNLVGSFLIGVFANHFLNIHDFFTIGVLGGFTTFSTFSVDALVLWQQQVFLKMFVYILVNMIGGLIFFSLGFII